MSLIKVIQSAANNEKSTAPLTWSAINNLLKDEGGPSVDYESFKNLWDNDPLVKNLVDKFDQYGIVVKTNQKEPNVNSSKKSNQLSKMAKRATSKAFK